MPAKLWSPPTDRVAHTNLAAFQSFWAARLNAGFDGYDALYSRSINDLEGFWTAVRDFCGVKADHWGERVLIDADKMPGAQFFPDARINFAENFLRRRDDSAAIVFRAEDKIDRKISWRELYDSVSKLAQFLKETGVKPGDRCAGFVPNMPEAIIAMLAATSLGAVWTSCSPDFGEQGVLDRFGQVKPKVLFTADGYYYGGKAHDSLARVSAIVSQLPSVAQVVVFPLLSDTPDVADIRNATTLADAVAPYPAADIEFEYMPFNDPVYIMYSSGTTGKPKCIVHGIGGTLLMHMKEHILHCDVKPDDRVFYFTTCGWMMWNWLVSALTAQATVVLYDGSPFYPDGNVLFDYADDAKMTLFGTSAKYIDALGKAGLRPKDTHDLSSIRTITSTGSPLVAEGFDYVYDCIKPDVCLSSIAGGTDLIGCFMGGNPTGPVYRGEIQTRLLGMAVDVFDEMGRSLRGEKGELVCTKPFPTMPLYFWDDPDGQRYHDAYFAKFPNVWCHGDFIELTDTGGIIIYGRSDATLNPGGVRIGTAEIYRQVEQFDEIAEGLVIGQEWDNDTRVVLFVVLAAGAELDDGLRERVRQKIRQNCTPRHVPAKIIRVTDIPRTRSGKITELAVRDVVHGRDVKNKEALANPEALDFYKDMPELQSA